MNLNEIFKFMNNRENRVLIWIILVAVIFFGLPGNVLIFVWNQELYLKMDIIKLLMLSFGIPTMSIVFVAIVTSIALWIQNKIFGYENQVVIYIGLAIVVNDIFVIYATVQKIITTKLLANKCIWRIIEFLIVILVFSLVEWTIRWIYRKVKKRKAKEKAE